MYHQKYILNYLFIFLLQLLYLLLLLFFAINYLVFFLFFFLVLSFDLFCFVWHFDIFDIFDIFDCSFGLWGLLFASGTIKPFLIKIYSAIINYRTVSLVHDFGPFTNEYLDDCSCFRLPIIVVTLLPFAAIERLQNNALNVSRNCLDMPQ